MTDKTAFEQWWHDKCETNYTYPNESSFIRRIAKEAWNAAIDAAAFKCDTVESDEILPPDEIADACKESILRLKSL